jgi:hypothetical protein
LWVIQRTRLPKGSFSHGTQIPAQHRLYLPGFVGLGLIFVPQRFGVDVVPIDASAALIAYLRLFGSPFLGIAVLNWMARNAEPSRAQNAIILGNIVGFAAIAVFGLWGLFSVARPVNKGVRDDSSAFHRCLHLGRENEHVRH